VFVAEDAEDIEDRDPRFFLLRSLRSHDGEQVIEGRLEFASGGERLGEIDAGLLVRAVCCECRLEFGEILAARCFQAGGRLETIDF
jgi:hypothetical protein